MPTNPHVITADQARRWLAWIDDTNTHGDWLARVAEFNAARKARGFTSDAVQVVAHDTLVWNRLS